MARNRKVSNEIASIGDLTPDPQNARKHNPRNVGVIVDSLHEVGAARSIVIDEDNVVLAGNATIEAAAEAGIEKLRVIDASGDEIIAVRRTGLTAQQKKRLALFDNRAADLAEWDAAVFDQFTADDIAGMFTADEVDAIISAGEEPATVTEDDFDAEAAAAAITEPTTKPGDLWLLGRHRLLCGDATSVTDVSRLRDGRPVDLVVTSPPYNQKIDSFKPSGMHKEGGWVAKVGRLAYADSLPEDDYQSEQAGALNVWFAVMRDGASIFYNHKNRYRDKRVVSPTSWLPGPFAMRQEIIWARPGSVTQNARMFLPSDERIFWMYKGDDFTFNDDTEIKSWSTVWKIGLETNREHAVAFPTELPTRCIRACSMKGDLVLDPYTGSGTTLVAAHQLGRDFVGTEFDPKYCDVIIARWEKLTGEKATLDQGTGH